MKIVVNRFKTLSKNSTPSTVEIDGFLKYYGMEPINPIPPGTYKVTKYFSPDHKKFVPLVNNVPGHAGIEIHAGNFPKDTKDCLLLGCGNMEADYIGASDSACMQFYALVFNALADVEGVTITYVNNF